MSRPKAGKEYMELVKTRYTSFEMYQPGYDTYKVDRLGNKFWKQNGKFHRTDGPAIEYANGDKYWYQNGELHCIDGPAIECANGDKEWYQNGKCHHTDGPAIQYANGTVRFFINDIEYDSLEEALMDQAIG